MDAPLTPNTSAFLSYLSSALESNGNPDNTLTTNNIQFKENTNNPIMSLPTSAIFPVPGRDTPEDTPPSSNETSQSPENNIGGEGRDGRDVSIEADDSDADLDSPEGVARRKSSGGQANHKRKAGAGNVKHDEEDEDDEDSASDFASGHDDKRQHPNAKQQGAGRKAGRKSTGEDGNGKGGKEVSKAARRKEQNRAAQKAFRERREAKVKDLEDKVAELEAKSYGTSVENENLRGILKRLQEENVALRQAAFTFTMPVNGNPSSGSGSNTPTQPDTARKPPTPPHTNSESSLRNVEEPPRPTHRSSSNLVSMGESPESLNSVASGNGSSSETNGNANYPVNLFDDRVNIFADSTNAFAAGALGGKPRLGDVNADTPPRVPSVAPTNNSRSESGISPQSSSSNNRTEIDALWASFLQPGKEIQNNHQAPGWNFADPSTYTMLSSNNLMSTPGDVKIGGPVNGNGTWDKFAFRDEPNRDQDQSTSQQQQQQQQQPRQQQQAADPWAGMMDNNVNDFLASLTGGDNSANADVDVAGDDDFTKQLQQILGAGASPSAPFNLPSGSSGNPFSPTNYLNMSPSSLHSISNGPSPQSQGNSISNSASPASSSHFGSSSGSGGSRGDSLGTGIGTFGPPKSEAEHVYVVDDEGKVIKPSELWVQMGMQHESNLEHLLIDDLCDMMRAKATCQDGRKVINAKDAAYMFKFSGVDKGHDERMRSIEQRAGIQPGTFSGPPPTAL